MHQEVSSIIKVVITQSNAGEDYPVLTEYFELSTEKMSKPKSILIPMQKVLTMLCCSLAYSIREADKEYHPQLVSECVRVIGEQVFMTEEEING